MKALSLYQPWASFCVTPRKDDPSKPVKMDETRSWRPPTHIILPVRIAIHASARTPKEDREYWEDDRLMWEHLGVKRVQDLPMGCLLGTVLLTGYSPTNHVKPDSISEALGNYGPNRFAWHIREPKPFATPIPCKGSLGLWEVPEGLIYDA